jgi:SAM-dependent methyltransferase
MLSREGGLVGVGYGVLGEPFNRWMYRLRRRLFLRTMRPRLDELPSRSVLDIGSGTGFYVDRWRELRIDSITGADLTEVAVRRLRARYPAHEFHRVDIGAPDPPLPRAAYGAVSAMDMLFHIVDDDRYRRAFANIFSLLSPGGLFVFSENFVHGETIRVPEQASRPIAEIESVLRETGFEILRRRPMFFLMNEPVDSSSPLHERFWWRLSGQLEARGPRAQWAIGAALYPIELAIVSTLREGPSTELVVCRKPSGRG